jgi:DNA ligase-1
MQPQLLTVVDKEALKTWTADEWTKWRIEPKYDGYRLTYHKGQFRSRTGKPFYNLEHIQAELARFSELTFDGELYGGSWEEAAKARRSKNGGVNTLRFAVFDMLFDEEWERQGCGRSFGHRRYQLCATIGDGELSFVHVPRQWKVDNYKDFLRIYDSNLAIGCDGTVLKHEDSLYEFKRTRTWLKVKPVQTFDCTVLGMREGEGKHKGRMGKLTAALDVGSLVTTDVGTGFTDVQRERWWNNQKEIVGKTIEVEARGVHKSGKLIEPRFIRTREDK